MVNILENSSIAQKFIRLGKDTIIYGAGDVFKKIVGFLLLPILTRIFSPADYGVIDVIATITVVILLFLSMGLNSATLRHYFDAKSKKEGAIIISTAFWFLLLISFSFCFIPYLFSKNISLFFFNNESFASVIKIAVIAIPFILLISLSRDVLRAKFAPWQYIFLNIISFVTELFLVIYLVVVIRMGIIGNFYGLLFSSILVFFLAGYLIRDSLKFSISFPFLKSLLRYGSPLIFVGLGYWIINLSDRFFLVKLSNLEEVGLYAVGNRIAAILLLVIVAFHTAWPPFILAHYKDKNAKKIISKILTYFVLFSVFISLILSLFSPEILKILVPTSYLGAVKVISLLLLSVIFFGTAGLVLTGISLRKKTELAALSVIIVAFVNIILNILLIPKWGMMGAAIATVISYFILLCFYYKWAQKFYPVSYEVQKVMKIFLLGILFFILANFIKIEVVLYAIVVKMIIVASFLLTIFYLNILDKTEKAILRIAYQKIKSKSFYVFKKGKE